MAKGRFLSKSISQSKRFANLSPEAAILYLLALPHADVAGLLESDPETLVLVYGGRFASRQSWTVESASALRDELVASGLWVARGEGVVEVYKFHDHNKVRQDRELPSRLRESSGSDPGVLPQSAGVFRESSGSTPPQVQVQVQVQGEGEGGTPPSLHDASSNGDTWKVSEEETRIRLSLVPAMPSGWYPSGMESYRIREYARGGACRRWPGDELRGHLCAQADKIAAKRGRRPDGLYLLDQINADWDPPAPRRSNGGAPEQVYEDWTGRGQSEDPFGVQEGT